MRSTNVTPVSERILPPPPSEVTAPAPTFFPCIDGLRALAIAAVVLHHCGNASGAFRNPTLGGYYARTEIAMPVFFLISGLVIYRPFVAARFAGRPAPAAGSFLLRRVLRIYPSYWVATLCVVYVLRKFPIDDLRGFVEYMTLAWVFDWSHYMSPIQPAWTLGTELTFYALLPALAALLLGRRRTSEPKLPPQIAGLLAAIPVSLLYKLWVFQSDDTMRWDMRLRWLPGYLDFLAIGMLLATISAAAGERRLRIPAFLSSKNMPVVTWSSAALLFVMLSSFLGLPTNRFEYSPGQYLLVHYLGAIIAIALVLPTIFGPQDQGLVRRFLRSQPMTLFGLLSYGVYLWHGALIWEFLDITGVEMTTGYLPQMYAAVLAASLAVAALNYNLVERPLRRLARPAGRGRTSDRDRQGPHELEPTRPA